MLDESRGCIIHIAHINFGSIVKTMMSQMAGLLAISKDEEGIVRTNLYSEWITNEIFIAAFIYLFFSMSKKEFISLLKVITLKDNIVQ